MEVNNPLYKNQGIHVIASIFTVDHGVPKVLLIKRANNPFKGMWALVGGALHNNETIDEGLEREINEKIGITLNDYEFYDLFSRVDRSPVMRMIGIGYIGVIDMTKVEILKKTLKTVDSDWFPLDKIPKLAYDHNEMLEGAIKVLKDKILNSNILGKVYPEGFTMPEIISVFESISNKTLDRRNARKKLLNDKLIYDTGKERIYNGKKPAKIYKFK